MGTGVALMLWSRAGPHLRAELLRRQLEGGCDLLSQYAGLVETEGVEGDLGDHGVIRNHHGHGPEEGLGHREYVWPSGRQASPLLESLPGSLPPPHLCPMAEGHTTLAEELNFTDTESLCLSEPALRRLLLTLSSLFL